MTNDASQQDDQREHEELQVQEDDDSQLETNLDLSESAGNADQDKPVDYEAAIAAVGIDVEGILAPISAASPTGKDLRDNTKSVYYKLRALREELRAKERQFIIDEGWLGGVDWTRVVSGSVEILSKKSKDVEVLAWLIEGLTRQHHFQGLTVGLYLLGKMVGDYWGSLHPNGGDNNIEITMASIEGLCGTSRDGVLMMPIYMAPILHLSKHQYVSTWDYIQSVEARDLDSDERPKNVMPLEKLEEECEALPRDAYVTINDVVNTTMHAIKVCDETLFVKTEDSWGYSFRNLETALKRAHEAIHYLGANVFAEIEAEKAAQDVVEGAGDDSVVMSQSIPAGKLHFTNAREVQAALEGVAEYYKTNHPHSPISYLVRKVMRWTTLELPQLIPEILADQHAQMEYCRMIGLDESALHSQEPEQEYQVPQTPQTPDNPYGGDY